MSVWVLLEQLPIEYYHPEFLKHVGKKLGKLLKIDAITRAAIRGRFTRVCVQINTANPLPKRVKIGSFWQDIVYENLLMFCYKCGRIGHREMHCTEHSPNQTTLLPHKIDSHNPTDSLHEPTHMSTTWKTVQTRRSRTRGRPNELMQHSNTNLAETYPVTHPRGHVAMDQTQGQRTQLNELVKRLDSSHARQPHVFNR